MGKTSMIQGIVIGLFVFFAIAGLVLFSISKSNDASKTIRVTIWGTAPQSAVRGFIKDVLDSGKINDIKITYIQKSATNFDQEFIEALASRKGPDAILIPHDALSRHFNKIVSIPFSSISQQNFRSSFIQEGEIYFDSSGILALPLSVDPMVMYWNRDMFTNANLAQPPKTWSDFLTIAPLLTKRDGALNITESAVAMGEARNVTHSKELLSLLIMQAGNPILLTDKNGITEFSLVNSKTTSALTFYTQFADPVKKVYSWNRSLPESKNLFIANKLAVYFGYASELQEIKGKNPNLNFAVAVVPQTKAEQGVTPVNMTYGSMLGLSIVKGTSNSANTFKALSVLVTKNAAPHWTNATGLPSVRRDVLNFNPGDEASTIFATSALWSRAWLDPNRAVTTQAFTQMVEDVTSGRSSVEVAIRDAENIFNGSVR